MAKAEADVGLGIPCHHTGCTESPLDSDAVRVCPCEQDSEMDGFFEIFISDCLYYYLTVALYSAALAAQSRNRLYDCLLNGNQSARGDPWSFSL